MRITTRNIQKFIQKAADTLDGNWVLLGGSVLFALQKNYRVTFDIDLIGFGRKERAQSFELIQLADELGFPPEVINQSAAIYLAKQKDWKKDLILLARGNSAQIYRPNIRLFRKLKQARGSPSDLQDIQKLEEWVRVKGDDHEKRLL